MKRTAIARGTKGLTRSSSLKSRSRLAPVSDRRREDNDGPWADTKRVVDERDGGRCWAAALVAGHVCSLGRHRHHVVPVGCGGDRHDPANVATLCVAGHTEVHNDWRAFKAAWDARDAA